MSRTKPFKKPPKPGTWKAIEYDLDRQDAIGKGEDGDCFIVYGDFSTSSINAFTDRWAFSVRPISALIVFKNNRRLKERMRFGGNDNSIREYDLWRKRRVHLKGLPVSTVDSPLNWDRRCYFYPDDDRYICRCLDDTGSRYSEYFYMDRVI